MMTISVVITIIIIMIVIMIIIYYYDCYLLFLRMLRTVVSTHMEADE